MSAPAGSSAASSSDAKTADAAPQRVVTGAELARHNTERDCWIAVGGTVYDVSAFLPDHPGGPETVIEHAGAHQPIERVDARARPRISARRQPAPTSSPCAYSFARLLVRRHRRDGSVSATPHVGVTCASARRAHLAAATTSRVKTQIDDESDARRQRAPRAAGVLPCRAGDGVRRRRHQTLMFTRRHLSDGCPCVRACVCACVRVPRLRLPSDAAAAPARAGARPATTNNF